MNDMRKLLESVKSLFDETESDLIDQVLAQIRQDVENNDFTAIEELLSFLPNDRLKKFLEY
jgi:hypothetical protein